MRDSAHIIYDVCESKLAVFFSRAISAAENKPSYKFDNRSLYQKARIGELPHFCNEMEKCNQYAMFAKANSQCFSAALFQRLKINSRLYNFRLFFQPY